MTRGNSFFFITVEGALTAPTPPSRGGLSPTPGQHRAAATVPIPDGPAERRGLFVSAPIPDGRDLSVAIALS